eukprot:CAMPEP_0194217078 /NCGR_PEP_ID=MMETSP0156-20130528/20290_1 /TAXON_ID=33649 /ORGANISM="Thalassionema nitzschioides, Strain L26-B" /LENGTH=427 /DNA_ID=CAMNT_0038946015 /DNA_START=51 /DNA_END=1334 /DNA_ORIENTATION=+
MDDAVEVKVEDDDVPMEENESDNENETNGQNPDNDEAKGVEDMAKVVLNSHADSIYCVASHFDESSKTICIISGGGDDKAFLHKIGNEIETLPLCYGHKDTVSCVALNNPFVSDDLSKTPKYAAVGAYDGAIIIYDPSTGAMIKELEGPSDVEFVSFHPKGGTVLLAGSADDGTVWMYHIPTSKCMQVFVGHENGATAGAFTSDGKWALSCSSDGTLRVWAPRTGVCKHVFRFGDHGAGLTCLATNDGNESQLVLVGAEDGMAHVCHIGGKKVIASLQHTGEQSVNLSNEGIEVPASVEAVGFAPAALNSNWCATGGVDGVLKIWDLNNNGCRHICRHESVAGQVAGITRLRWHPCRPIVFTTASDGIVRIWDARSGKLLKALTGHGDIINDLDVNTFGESAIIISGSDDKSIRVFDYDIAAPLSTS